MFTEEIKKSLERILPGVEISLEHPADLKHGDYSTNVALAASKLQSFKVSNPKELAGEIVKKWQTAGLPDFVEKIKVAGVGFINIWLKFDALGNQLVEVLREGENYGRAQKCAKTMVIDYSAPNIAKPFGIGHLRSTNIGQAIYNFYKFLGWKVVGDNHLGDWGTQFGKLIYQINKNPSQNLTIEVLEQLYIEFHQEAEKDPKIESEARAWFKKLEEGDKEAKGIWQTCVDISKKEFDRVYKLLGVQIDYTYGESFYQDKMEAVLEDCRKKGILKESQGAQVVEIPGEELPGMLVKSDGATTYLLRDLATVKFRKEKWQPDLFVYEVGADQTLHFNQLFKICEQLGYGNKEMFVHVAHGLIRWKEGKFSTRKGTTIHLKEVLDEAVKRAAEINQDSAIAVGIGAVKYNDLKQNPRTDVIFDWEQMLSLQGNSGPYLQYTYARTQSVLAKSEFLISNFKINSNFKLLNAEEIVILRMIYKFPESVKEAAESYSPNLICNFLYDLAQKFNLFYDKQRIIGSERQDFRLALTAGVGQTLKNGLNLLGIEALERM